MTVSNQLTLLRACSSIVLIPILAIDDQLARLFGLLIFAMAAFSDYYDGRLARMTGQTTRFGIIADPIADKLLTIVAFVALTILQPSFMPLWMTVLIVIREFLITVYRLAALVGGRVLAADRWGKWKTGFQITAIVCALLATALFSGEVGRSWEAAMKESGCYIAVLAPVYGLSLIATLLTVISGIHYVHAELSLRRNRRG